MLSTHVEFVARGQEARGQEAREPGWVVATHVIRPLGLLSCGCVGVFSLGSECSRGRYLRDRRHVVNNAAASVLGRQA